MHPLLILGLAITIVLIGILVIKLHAFIALLLAGMAVAVMTSSDSLEEYAKGDFDQTWLKSHTSTPTDQDSHEYKLYSHDRQQHIKSISETSSMKRVANGFGSMCGKIGILIAMASLIGKCLLDSGAADKIVRTLLKLFGEARASVSFVGSSFLLSIPVFFDTVFYLMVPLAKAMRMKLGENYLLMIMAIVAGGSMAHSLVPPTPGPLVVAEEFNVSIITMIVAGCCVGLVASFCGYTFAKWLNGRMEIPLRDSPDARLEDLRKQSEKPDSELPSFWIAIAPILLPVVLIAMATFTKTYCEGLEEPIAPPEWIMTLGDKNVALIIAAAVAFITLLTRPDMDRSKMGKASQDALASAGVIILITSAGGGFGEAIRQCGIKEYITAMSSADFPPLLILPIVWLITMVIRTAQGSSTVAMITTAAIFSSLASADGLGYHPVYLALAIGTGSKPIAWMADSGFWVVCKMSGMTESEALKTITPMSCITGISGLAATLIGAWLFPLV